ncbi:Metallo-dependent phosphatase-like [Phytophthora cactorum]|nr:Metallo-dependent phosphatase-like [Phytophthora cactorum]
MPTKLCCFRNLSGLRIARRKFNPLAFLENQGFKTQEDFKAWRTQNGYKTLRDFMEHAKYNVTEGADFSCGWTNPKGTPQPIPAGGIMRSTGYTHDGPCEVWVADTRVYQGDNCHESLPRKEYPIDYSPCKGTCVSTGTGSVYKECIPLISNSTTNSSHATVTLAAQTSAQVSDPATAKYSVSVFGIGDWGATTYKGSCCGSNSNNYDLNSQEVVATLMNIEAGASLKPKAVLAHGDNFYWNGINYLAERDGRFAASFESKYDGDNIKSVPWVAVMGNHDYGGSDYICSSGDKLVPCNNTAELFQGLENKFKWQSEYTSPNDNRWAMDGRFYVHRVKDPATGVSIDIFNVDTNDNDHGKYCFGGDKAMFDTCKAKFAKWGNESRTQLAKLAAKSDATWKIVNSHYSPYDHYAEPGMKKWFDALRNSGKHDYSKAVGVHFIENGAGGGRQSGKASHIQAYAANLVKNEWSYTPGEYGFFSMQASTDWMKLQYHTADNKWNFTEKWEDTTIGCSDQACWYIPADGSEGKAC